ncbi:Ig-like domain-containing protein [Psychrobacillus sp. NPDC096426]|uniref:Ig-like domain-containing protein n=1 Tax=Psychrobacillus sp. NPDC096426 TaxID=3364491 RepID=UPI0038200ED7
MLRKNMFVWILVLTLFISLVPVTKTSAACSEWITLPELKEVPLSKVFTVTFNKEVTLGDIDSLEIFQGQESIPVKIEAKEKQAFVTPVNKLTPNTKYEIRIVIGAKRYIMTEQTVGTASSETLTYEGIKDVRSSFADGQLIKDVHHYSADFGEGHPINIYVTDDYEKRYGKGFSYDETISIVNSIESYRKTKPYTTELGTLNIFFYTNESNTALPKEHQAVIGSWRSNTGDGVAAEMLMNGSMMPYDFRSSYVHKFIHYFDFQSFITEKNNPRTFEKFWGPNYRLWLLEGGAEYGGYFFYNYPENSKNNLKKDFVLPTRESILDYAKAQGRGKDNLILDIELDSFDDIDRASSNNYGVTLSLFWYLVEQYGYNHVYDYVRYIGDTFEGQQLITKEEKDNTAIKFFGKTEEQILQNWLDYFNYFDGKLQEYKETKTGTVNYVFRQGNPLLPHYVDAELGLRKDGTYHFAVNISEWIADMDYTQAYTFREKSTFEFQLNADGYPPVNVKRTIGFFTDTLSQDQRLFAFDFYISKEEQSKLVKGVDYKLQPLGNDSTYKWVIPDHLTFKW